MSDIADKKEMELKRMFLVGALLSLLAVTVFLNVFKNDFVGYDVQNLLLKNQEIHSLSPHNLASMFVPRHRGNYQPLRTLSYAVDYAIWGLRPFGFQLTNIILHVITVLGIWRLASRLVPERVSFIAAAIFAVHPIHVESVTWMSARKDVLCLAFLLLAMLSYERAESQKKLVPYLISIVATALALLSKLTAVVLPACILLLEVCRDGWPTTAELRRKLIRLLPHILLACVILGLNFVQLNPVPSHGDPLAELGEAGSSVVRDIRLSMPLVVCRYIGLLFLPVGLSTHYDVARISEFASPAVLIPSLFLVAMIVIGIICFLSGRRIIAFCIGWFIITFLPTANIIPTAAMMTDRYMHVPSIGFAIFCALVVGYPAERISQDKRPLTKMLTLFPIIIIILLFSILTIRRNTDWRDTNSLFSRTLLVSPRSVDAHLAIGAMYDLEGDYDSAIKMYQAGLRIEPDNYRVLYNMGVAYMKKGWLYQAIEALEKSRAANAVYAPTHFNLAMAYHQQRRYEEAISEHREALRLKPDLAVSYIDLGRIYIKMEKPELALTELNRALELQPDLVPALIDRATLFIRQGRHEEAEKDLRRLESLHVDVKSLRARLGAASNLAE